MRSITRAGPSELFRGFLASSLRDAPYAGLFVVCYEGIKHEAASILLPSSHLASAALHSCSAAAAGTIATLATHPFDVIKVLPFLPSIVLALITPNRPECKFELNTNIMASSKQLWLCGTLVPFFNSLLTLLSCLYLRNGAYMVSLMALLSASLEKYSPRQLDGQFTNLS